jgi:hypothetical protein
MTTFLRAAALATALTACTHLDSEQVTFDGRSVEVVEAGAGDATVVFESGLGDDWKHWDRVASDVAEHARIFAYSRPGYGHSDPTDGPRDPATVVEELRGLLASEDYAPPYVLVGHSLGGSYMELLAKTHPDEVAGAVLVEPRPSGFLDECESQDLDMCGITEDQLERQPDVVAAEYREFSSQDNAELDAAGGLGDYPVRVMTGTKTPGTSDERQDLWMSMQRDIALEAADGGQIVVQGGHHYLQVQQPDEVTAAVLALLP